MLLTPHMWDWRSAEIMDHCWNPSQQMITLCIGWGSYPTWNYSRHIHSKQTKKGDWLTSYVMDGDMEPPSHCYHHTCGTQCENSAEIIDHCWVPSQITPSCSGWGSHPTWNGFHIQPKHLQGDWQTHMQWMGIWSPHHDVTTTRVGPNLERQLRSWTTAGLQMTPSCRGWGSHPTRNDSQIHSKHKKGHLKYHTQWIGLWIPHHAVTTTILGPNLERQLKSWITPES